MKLTREEIEQFRNPTEFIDWFDEVFHRMLSEPDEATRAILLHKGIYKIIHEEIFPLRSLLIWKGGDWSSSRFRNRIGNQNYDVEIKGHFLDYLEIATSEFNDGEVFRMNELMREGSVSAFAPVVRDSNGRVIDLKDRGEMRLHDEVISERIDLIRSIIAKKSKKNYPENTGLIVYFDDSLTKITKKDQLLLSGLLAETKSLWSQRFRQVFLVGPQASVCIEDRT